METLIGLEGLERYSLVYRIVFAFLLAAITAKAKTNIVVTGIIKSVF